MRRRVWLLYECPDTAANARSDVLADARADARADEHAHRDPNSGAVGSPILHYVR